MGGANGKRLDARKARQELGEEGQIYFFLIKHHENLRILAVSSGCFKVFLGFYSVLLAVCHGFDSKF